MLRYTIEWTQIARSWFDHRSIGRRSVRHRDLFHRGSFERLLDVVGGIADDSDDGGHIGHVRSNRDGDRAGLMRALARSMPPRLAVALAALVMLANTFNIGADLAAMAASAHMLLPVPLPLWITGFALLIAGVEIFFSYRAFAQVVKWLCASLLAYLVTAVIVHPPWLEILWNTLIPHVQPNRRWLTMLVGTLGTTITPYLFFWQTSMMVEERRDAGRSRLAQRLGATPREIQSAHADVNTGAIYSNVIMFFIIVTSAATLGAHGATGIDGAQQAALALRPLAGNFAYALFALGIVGTGLLAIPVLAGSSAYMFSELYGLAEGLSLRPLRARGFYGIILCGVGAGTLMALLRVNPLAALFWSAVFNGIAAVPLVYAILRLAHDPAVLGRWDRVADGLDLAMAHLFSHAAGGSGHRS